MTKDFETAFDLANLMSVISQQKKVIKEEFETSTLYFYNGGTFKVDQTLISFVTSLKILHQTTAVIIDQNNLPIFIDNVVIFLENILHQYTQASNKFLTDYKNLQINRKIESILNL